MAKLRVGVRSKREVFLQVGAERASFARAADHLGLSPSALSQTIRQLESRLGVRLLNRTTRSVTTTEPGRRLHERMAPILREMDDAVTQAMGTSARAAGTLRINTLSMAAKKVIAPRLGRSARANPDVVLDIVIDDGLTDITGEGFDAGINWRFPGSGKVAGWQFNKKGKEIEFLGEGGVISNHQDIVVPAALQGLGIFYVYNDDGIAEALRDGRLKRVMADWSPTVPGLFLYYSSRRYVLPALRAFIDCLLDRDVTGDEVQR